MNYDDFINDASKGDMLLVDGGIMSMHVDHITETGNQAMHISMAVSISFPQTQVGEWWLAWLRAAAFLVRPGTMRTVHISRRRVNTSTLSAMPHRCRVHGGGRGHYGFQARTMHAGQAVHFRVGRINYLPALACKERPPTRPLASRRHLKAGLFDCPLLAGGT